MIAYLERTNFSVNTIKIYNQQVIEFDIMIIAVIDSFIVFIVSTVVWANL